jgi:hypothetical protein
MICRRSDGLGMIGDVDVDEPEGGQREEVEGDDVAGMSGEKAPGGRDAYVGALPLHGKLGAHVQRRCNPPDLISPAPQDDDTSPSGVRGRGPDRLGQDGAIASRSCGMARSSIVSRR